MKTLRVTLADIVGPTGTPNSTATVHARYVDTSGRGRDVHLTDGTIVVPVRRVASPDGDPEVFDFDVYANDAAPVREVDYGHLVEVSWTVVAPTGAKTSGVRRVAITDDMDAVVQLGLLSTPTPVPPYTGGYVTPETYATLVDRMDVFEEGGPVWSVNGENGVVTLDAADVGAATTAQGVKADTAVQPADLTAVTPVDARRFGVVADGVTDDSAAWNALIASSQPGTAITFRGVSALHSRVALKSGVSIIGQGWGRSVFRTVSTSTYFPALSWQPGDGAGALNPLEEVTLAHFEIDGSGITGSAANIAGKGIFTQWTRRCAFLYLYVHDTVASGIGTDYMPECIIHGCIVKNAGRNYVPGSSTGGMAGIGIGTGAWEDEHLIISDCHTVDCGQWGIFTEYQADQPFRGRGIVVSNCTATGAEKGFGDRGTAGTSFVNCTAANNDYHGFSVSFGARNGSITNCVSHHNGREGIHLYLDTYGDYVIRGNRSHSNNWRGIFVEAFNDTLRGVTVDSNDVHSNGYHGVYCTTSLTGSLPDLVVRGNRSYNNGQVGASQPHGIRIDANTTGLVLASNRCYDNQGTKTQTAGIKLSDSASFSMTDARIEGNVVTGNATAGISLGGTVRTRVSVRANTGYVTENYGTATVAAGSASVTVTHGLAAAPVSVAATPRTSEGVWVSDRTSSTFTLTRAVTTLALEVDWQASL